MAPVSSVKRFAPDVMPAAVSISSRVTRLCPTTSTPATANRGDLSSHPAPNAPAASTTTTASTHAIWPPTQRARRATRRRRRCALMR